MSRHSILVVDDDPINLAILEEMFSDPSFEVRSALSGEEALRLVEEELPDIILLDVMMPEMDGFEVCQQLKADARTAWIPVLFLTASTHLASKLKGFSCGGADYIVKPFDTQEVMARVQTHLKLLDAQRLIRRHSEELEEMLQERTRDLIQSERRAAFSLLIEGIIHNLRGPLTAIMGLADCAKVEAQRAFREASGLMGESAGRVCEHLQSIDKDAAFVCAAARELNGMINSMMAKSRSDRTSKAEVVDLNKVLDAELNFLNGDMRFKHNVKKHIRLVARPLDVWAVRSELAQLAGNLLRNALDATFEQERPELVVETRRDDHAGTVTLVVEDSGPGIPPEHRERVFDPFFTTKPRADKAREGEPSGTGLGLHTVFQICDSYHGSLCVGESAMGGASISVTLPLYRESNESADQSLNEKHAGP